MTKSAAAASKSAQLQELVQQIKALVVKKLPLAGTNVPQVVGPALWSRYKSLAPIKPLRTLALQCADVLEFKNNWLIPVDKGDQTGDMNAPKAASASTNGTMATSATQKPSTKVTVAQPQWKDLFFIAKTKTSEETSEETSASPTTDEFKAGLSFLPERFLDFVLAEFSANPTRMRDLALDVGRPLVINFQAGRVWDDRDVVTQEDLDDIVAKLPPFTSDDRTGPHNALHRVSAFRNYEGSIYGLTVRIGRRVLDCSVPILDVLQKSEDNVLILGPPGAGKTTFIRDIVWRMNESTNQIVVDTSNEICGWAGGQPHASLGKFTRRAMVQNREKQDQVMIQVLQNHTPDIMVIDEIGRDKEVRAAATCSNRGVRLFASAHGSSVVDLVNNRELRGLVGGIQQNSVGDMTAREISKGSKSFSKVYTERTGSPVFQTMVILPKNPQDGVVQVIRNVAEVVDAILAKKPYNVEVRQHVGIHESFSPAPGLTKLTDKKVLPPANDSCDRERVLVAHLSSSDMTKSAAQHLELNDLHSLVTVSGAV